MIRKRETNESLKTSAEKIKLEKINIMDKKERLDSNRSGENMDKYKEDSIKKRDLNDQRRNIILSQNLKAFQKNFIFYPSAEVNTSELILETLQLWFDSEYHLMDHHLVDKFEVTDNL